VAFEHEKPKPPPGQLTVGSSPHVVSVELWRQQNSVDPALPAVPSLQRSELSESSGVSLPRHEYPVPSSHETVESVAQLEPPGGGAPADEFPLHPSPTTTRRPIRARE
jgi:hypothetical protein